jgi:hypothetical protein
LTFVVERAIPNTDSNYDIINDAAGGSLDNINNNSSAAFREHLRYSSLWTRRLGFLIDSHSVADKTKTFSKAKGHTFQTWQKE